MEKVPEQVHTSPNQTGDQVVSNIEDGVEDPVMKKRYRKPNTRKRNSKFRGVSKCKGRFESFVWVHDPNNSTMGRKGRTVYIGGFKTEDEAAKAHDVITMKIWGTCSYTNFPKDNYEKQLSEWKDMDYRECILEIRKRIGKLSSTTGSNDLNIFRNQEGTVSGLAKGKTTDDALPNKICDPASKPLLVEQHVTLSPPGDAVVEMQENYAVGATLPNDSSIIVHSLLQDIGEEFGAPIASKNLHEGVTESHVENQFMHDFDLNLTPDLAFENDLVFQNGESFPRSFDRGSASVGNHTQTLGNNNALNLELSSSVPQMGDLNPIASQNGGVGSFGVGSSVEFGAPNLQSLMHQRYEPFQPGCETKTSSRKMVENDLDVSQYLNLNDPDMQDENCTKYMDHDWSESSTDARCD